MKYLIYVDVEYHYGCCDECCGGTAGNPMVTQVIQAPDGTTHQSISKEFQAWFKSEYALKDRKGKAEMTRNRQNLYMQWVANNPNLKLIDKTDYEVITS